jgi:hypothetical protein
MCHNLVIRQDSRQLPENRFLNESLTCLTIQICARKAISHYER